jgi:rod shape-determining protein MreC
VNVLRSRALIVVLLLALILAWLILDQAGQSNPIRDTFSQLVAPVQFVLTRLTGPIGQAVEGVIHLGRLQSQNDALRSENIQLRNQILLLQEAERENEALRRQLNYKSSVPSFQLLSAEVIGLDSSNLLQYLIIDRGADDGVQQGMPVLAAEGLVGRIDEVSKTSAKVMLITDVSSSISALIQRSRATGLVQGYPGAQLRMRYIPQGDTVEVGDVVFSSGLGGSLPKRLVIGQVVRVQKSDVEMFQEADIVPAVNLRDLESVMILLNFARIEPDQEESAGADGS